MDTITELKKEIRELEDNKYFLVGQAERVNRKIQEIKELIVVLEHLKISDKH